MSDDSTLLVESADDAAASDAAPEPAIATEDSTVLVFPPPTPAVDAMPEPKPEPPPRYVSVPRAVFDEYWPRPWVDVVAAAVAGRDGLTPWSSSLADVAVLREGDDGQTLLYQQHW